MESLNRKRGSPILGFVVLVSWVFYFLGASGLRSGLTLTDVTSTYRLHIFLMCGILLLAISPGLLIASKVCAWSGMKKYGDMDSSDKRVFRQMFCAGYGISCLIISAVILVILPIISLVGDVTLPRWWTFLASVGGLGVLAFILGAGYVVVCMVDDFENWSGRS